VISRWFIKTIFGCNNGKLSRADFDFCIRKDEDMIDEGIDMLKGWENF